MERFDHRDDWMEPRHRFARWRSSDAAFEFAIPHGVVPQLLRPTLAACIASYHIVVGVLEDEQRCVDSAEFTDDEYAIQLGEHDIRRIATYPYLVCLTLNRQFFTTSILGLVATLTQLQHLGLSHCVGVDAAGLAEFTKLTKLQTLDLTSCHQVDAAALGEVAKLTQLQRLVLSDCNGVDAARLAEVAKLSRLQLLNLRRCRGVDAAGLAEVAKLMVLEHLCLRGADGVNAAGLAEVAKLTQLRHLDLSYCHGADSSSLTDVAKLPQLKYINLEHCYHVSAAHLRALRGMSPHYM